jgi:hypothetical protein
LQSCVKKEENVIAPDREREGNTDEQDATRPIAARKGEPSPFPRDLQRFVLLDEVLVVSLWPRCEEEQHLRHMDQTRNVRESAACCVPDEQRVFGVHVYVWPEEPHGANGLPRRVLFNGIGVRVCVLCLCAHCVRPLQRANQWN